MLHNLRYAFLNNRGQEHSTAAGQGLTNFSCLLKVTERLRRRQRSKGRQTPSPLTHLHNFRARVSCQTLLRGVDDWDLHQCVQLPITNGGHQILACWQWQSREREKKLAPCLRENFCAELEVNLATALNEISWDSGWFFYRGSPLEVPYRNRKSRAAELRVHFHWPRLPLLLVCTALGCQVWRVTPHTALGLERL